MCGICGEISFGGPADPAAVRAMMGVLSPRGPDASGLFAQGAVAFGHCRLKIIDLSEAGQQPMVDPELGLAVVFNGCIYNYPALREELTAKGYRFFSTSDTEVLLKAYHAWGPACVERLLGMFAFAVLERDGGRVVFGRDRLGIKPLYFAETKGRLRFASSLPALLAAGDVDTAIDPVGLHNYMSLHAVVPAPRTILKGVTKLPPRPFSPWSRTAVAGRAPTGPSTSARVPRMPASARPSGASGCSTCWRSPSSGAGSPTCRPACCSRAGSTARSSWRCSPARGSGASRPSRSVSTR